MKITVLNKKGEKTNKTFELDETIFDNKSSLTVLRQAVHVHLTNSRTGTAKAKGRAEVSGTGKKPWGNNKMGKARTGDLRTPIFRGGGVSHGPVPMNYSLEMPKKMKKLALNLALTSSVKENKFHVVEDFDITAERLTNEAFAILTDLQRNAEVKAKSAIIFYKEASENFIKAFRNIKGVRVLNMNHMNAYDVLSASDVIVFESAMEKLNNAKASVKKAKETTPETKEVKTVKAQTASKTKNKE